MTTHSSGRRFGVRSVYTLAGEWGTGSHPLVLPSIDVSRQSTGFGKTMRLKASLKKKTVVCGRKERSCTAEKNMAYAEMPGGKRAKLTNDHVW